MSAPEPQPTSPIHLFRLELVAEQPFAVAAPELAAAIDSPIARRPDGSLFLPVSSLVGALRSHLRSQGLDEQLLGSRTPLGATGSVQSKKLDPSPLRLLGARAADATATWVRGQTGIDRERAAAAPGTLRTKEIAPAGTALTIYGMIRRELSTDELEALASWQPWVGGGRTSGLGRFELRSVRHQIIDLHTPAGRRRWLLRSGTEMFDDLADEQPVSVAKTEPFLAADVAIIDPLFTAARPGDEQPGPPKGSKDRSNRGNESHFARRSDGSYALEGTSIKGVFRSRCEFILTSIGLPARQVEQLTIQLFGATDRRGMLTFSTTPISEAVGAKRDHVGIDRFTGGARDTLLFSDHPIIKGTFTIEIDRLDTEPPPWVDPLLRCVLRDIDDGYVGLGGRTSRGYGTVAVTEIRPAAEHQSIIEALSAAGATV